jgi:hypothetical protein
VSIWIGYDAFITFFGQARLTLFGGDFNRLIGLWARRWDHLFV